MSRPVLAAAIGLTLIVVLILLSRFKHDILLMTINFVDLMVVDADDRLCGVITIEQLRRAVAAARPYLILDSRNSTCFLATGSYFFFTSLSVMVREFLRVT